MNSLQLQVEQMAEEGRIEEAFALPGLGREAELLRLRYKQSKEQNRVGILDNGDFRRVVVQTKYALLEIAGQVKDVAQADLSEERRLLKEAYYHLHTLRLIEEANPRLPKSRGLDETYFAIKTLLTL